MSFKPAIIDPLRTLAHIQDVRSDSRKPAQIHLGSLAISLFVANLNIPPQFDFGELSPSPVVIPPHLQHSAAVIVTAGLMRGCH